MSIGFAPPLSKTGVELTSQITVGYDWLRGTIPISQFDRVRAHLETVFSEPIEPLHASDGRPRPSQNYRRQFRSASGLYLGVSNWFRDDSDPQQHFMVNIPGSVLSRFTPLQQHTLFCVLYSEGMHCSRLDIKVDDYGKEITVAKVYEAAKAGNFTGFRKWEPYYGPRQRGDVYEGPSTVYFGSRGKSGSGRFLRIYDKAKQSSGEIDATRVELELSGDKAFEAFENISSLDFDFFKDLAVGYVKSSISFIDRVSSHISRCPVLRWWDSLFSDFTAIHFSPKVVVKTYQKSLDWLENQVAPTFAMVLESLAAISPDDAISFFYKMWFKGNENMSEKQKFLLRSWLASNGLIPCMSTS